MRKRWITRQLRKHLKWFKEHRGRNVNMVACLAFVYGDVHYKDKNGQCHIGLYYERGRGRGLPTAVITGLQKSNMPMPNLLRCIDFLINRSIYKKAFISDDSAQVLGDRAYVFNTDVNYNYMSSAVIATRWTSESGGQQAKTWIRMVDEGIDENVALILSGAFLNDVAGVGYTLDIRAGHMALDGDCHISDKQDCLNYLNTNHYQQKCYKKIRTYDAVNYFFSDRQVDAWNNNNLFRRWVLNNVGKPEGLGEDEWIFPIDNHFIKHFIGNNLTAYTTKQIQQIETEILKGVNYDWQQA